ncbi:MAG: hypothetical protein QOJ46_1884 [bacterium]|jgi:uncharacterized protein YkwD
MFVFRSGAADAARRTVTLTSVALTLAAATANGAPAAITAAAPAGCAAATVIPANPTMRQAAADAVLCLINAERTQRGLAPVLRSSLLGKAANHHASDMVRRKYFSHVSPNGEDLHKRVARTGYLRGARRPALGETLAWGSDLYASPAQLVDDLMHSAEHKAIIVDRRYRDIGVGLALGAPMDGMGSGSTLSLNFGRR